MVFQSSPAPKGRCNEARMAIHAAQVFQSSPAPKGRCNAEAQSPGRAGPPVSILTGPEGPMQRQPLPLVVFVTLVSILTGPEGPMQPQSSRRPDTSGSFNPHRPRRADATSRTIPVMAAFDPFQSSPAPKGRCNDAGQSGRDAQRGFNPHRPRRADATAPARKAKRARGCFNPHRPRRADATAPENARFRRLQAQNVCS